MTRTVVLALLVIGCGAPPASRAPAPVAPAPAAPAPAPAAVRASPSAPSIELSDTAVTYAGRTYGVDDTAMPALIRALPKPGPDAAVVLHATGTTPAAEVERVLEAVKQAGYVKVQLAEE